MRHLKTYESFYMRREFCDRCWESTNNTTNMSIFNTDVICMNCKSEERKDPEYGAAESAEREALKAGDTNFKGIMPDYTPIKRN